MKLISFLFILFLSVSGTKAQSSDNIHGGSANGIVGKIQDEFKVTPNGQFNYEIPIAAVSGTGGMTPQLSITYNSSNKNGLLGYGFDLTGLSLITRSPENLYRDGKADVIRFDSSDRFSLDGIRLSLVNTTATNREYRTEINSFSKIIAEGDAVNPSKFIVYAKDGITHEYTSAKALAGKTGNNLYWLETKVSDTKGNYYTITYWSDTENNEYRPKQIDYTGNASAALAPFASIRFSYQQTDRSPAYISGVKSLRSYAINNISIYYGNRQVRKYEISYTSASENLFISQITETAGTEKKNPTRFSWNNTSYYRMSVSTTSSDASFTNKSITVGDFNGDGKADFISRPNNNQKDFKYQIYLSNGKKFKEPISGEFLLPDNKTRIEEIRSGDFNGDGYDDIVVLRSNSPYYVLDLYLSEVDNNGNIHFTYNKKVTPTISFDHTMVVMDANSDGAADLFLYGSNFYSNSYYSLLSSSTDYGITPLATQYKGTLPDNDNFNWNVTLVDLDGDGMCEVLNVREKGFNSVLYRMLPTGELQKNTGLTLDQSDYYNIGDFNSDGKTDIMITGSSEDEGKGWNVNFATGLLSSPYFSGANVTRLFNPKDRRGYTVDLNGDGYDDFFVVDRKTQNNQKKTADIYINDGTGKKFTHYSGPDVYGSDKCLYEFGDFNGDGKVDCISHAVKGDNTPGYEVYSATDSNKNLLASITDGLGNTTSIEYRNLTDNTVFTRGRKTGYPLVSAGCSWSVVSKIITPNGIGGYNYTGYQYENALIHKRGRGMLCFEKFIEKDYKTGAVTTSIFEVLNSEMVPALKSVKTAIDNRIVKDVEYTNTLSYQLNNGKKEAAFTCYPTQVEERSYEYNTGTLVSDTRTSTEYDKYGNATKITVVSGDKTVTTENTYTNDEARWILGRLTKSVVTKEANGESIALTSEFEYDSSSGLLVSESFEPENIKGYVKTYKYDKYGNVIEDTTTPNDNSYSPQTHKTEYTGDGRFKIKSVNALGFVSTSDVDNILGVETCSTDINGISCTYRHNAFGELQEVETPLCKTKTTKAWSQGHDYSPDKSLFYIKTETTGEPTQWEFFDCLGRTLRNVIINRDGSEIYVDVVYNSKGQVVQSSEPYFKWSTPGRLNICEYDNAGRIIKETNVEGHSTTTNYAGLTTSVTDPLNHTSSKTIDLNGNLIKSTDAKGNSITYKYNVNGKCTEVAGPGTTINIEYDELGNKTRLSDPDMGIIEYGYNSFGELTWQKDSKGTTTFEYDNAGRLVEEYRPDFTYTHVYDTKWKGALSMSSCSNGMSHEYFYDNYGRVISEKETINGETFTTSRTYNSMNKVDVITYPNGFEVKNNYSDRGYLISVTDNSTVNPKEYWSAGQMNARRQFITESLGNGTMNITQYNPSGTIKQTYVTNGVGRSYTYDANNNLTSRNYTNHSIIENFEYDELDRLVRTSGTNMAEQKIVYDDAGNITYKTGVGNISYQSGTNRISSISEGAYSLPVWDNIEYTSFNKISSAMRDYSFVGTRKYHELTLQYGADKTRKFEQVIYFSRRWNYNIGDGSGSKNIKTKYYVGNLYEKEINESDTREINYIFAYGKVVAIHEKSDMDGETILYVHHDNIGSVMAYTNEDKQIVEELNYDAWGRRRNPDTFEYHEFSSDDISLYDNGFTGHEHIDLFDMINMNGRMYDPVVGRFLSPDPYVQAPDYTQSLNRYAYCINNPLTLTDPSGYNWIEKAFATVVGIAVGIETGGLATGVYGAMIGGALGGASASMLSSVFNGANLWQTAKGTFTGAFWGAASGSMNFGIGNIGNVYLRIAAHTAAEGAMEGTRGGHIEHGMLMGFTSSVGGAMINKYATNLTYAERVAVNATLGGIVSELGGGKFASGAMTAAYSMMFNDLAHELFKRNRLFMCSDKYKEKHKDWKYRLRRKTFNFMINRSKYTGNEVAAVALDNGSFVVFHDENNTPLESKNYYADTRTGNYVSINGSLEVVNYQVHTHPICYYNIKNPLGISGPDITMANNRFYGEVHILDVSTQNYYSVFTNQLYGIQQIQWK